MACPTAECDAHKRKGRKNPDGKTSLRTFLGFVGWYRKFIYEFSERAAPISKLLKDEQPFRWGEAQQAAFEDLRKAVLTAPVLQIFDAALDAVLRADASKVGIGGTLLQDQGAGLKPCMYLSKKLNDTEKNWHPYELETYAVIHCLETWKHLLIGTFVEIQTDHKPLTYFQSQSKVTGKIARWLDLLSEFNFKITHIPREKNVPQDDLSKRPNFYDELEALAAKFGNENELPQPIPSGCPNPRAKTEMVQHDAELWAGETFLDQIMTQVIFDDALRG